MVFERKQASKQTYTHTHAQCSLTSVGLTQAHTPVMFVYNLNSCNAESGQVFGPTNTWTV